MKHTLPQQGTHPDRRAIKRALRDQLRRTRDALDPAARARATARAAAHLLALPELARAATVGVYAARPDELDPGPAAAALRARGVAIAYPRVVRGRRRLAFHLSTPDELVPGGFGLREPPRDARAIAAALIDAFIVPGLGFDPAGGRLGWGRAHYDATLADAPRALRVGYAHACQHIQNVPVGPRDVPMDVVVTDAGPIRVGSWPRTDDDG